MAVVTQAQALMMSIHAVSTEKDFDPSLKEALEMAFAEERDAPDDGDSDCELDFKQRSNKEACPTPSTTFSDTSEDILEALELAEAEALEFERQESGADDERLHDLKNDVAQVGSHLDQRSRASSDSNESDLLSERRVSRSWSISEYLPNSVHVEVQAAPTVIRVSSPLEEQLEDAIAESIESFQRQESGQDEVHVASLESSLKAARANSGTQRIVEDIQESKVPQCIFSEPHKCNTMAALEEAEMEMLEARAEESSDEEDDEEEALEKAPLRAIRKSITSLYGCN